MLASPRAAGFPTRALGFPVLGGVDVAVHRGRRVPGRCGRSRRLAERAATGVRGIRRITTAAASTGKWHGAQAGNDLARRRRTRRSVRPGVHDGASPTTAVRRIRCRCDAGGDRGLTSTVGDTTIAAQAPSRGAVSPTRLEECRSRCSCAGLCSPSSAGPVMAAGGYASRRSTRPRSNPCLRARSAGRSSTAPSAAARTSLLSRPSWRAPTWSSISCRRRRHAARCRHRLVRRRAAIVDDSIREAGGR